MAGESDWGQSSKYVGKTKLPPSEWEYSNEALLNHLKQLQALAGIKTQPGQVPTPDQEIQAARMAWQALRSSRSMQA
jgi:hypothetical protein